MKDQYFGDINDYRKYGLLRAIICASGFRVLVAWMLTPDDRSTDGKFTSYIENPKEWSRYDPVLFQQIKALLVSGHKREVGLIEGAGLIPKAEFYTSLVPDTAPDRREWFKSLAQRAEESDFVFLDPDNGLEVKSKAYGRKNSSKYLYWREVQALWVSGKSLLIYQHFIRENRLNFIQRTIETLGNVTPGSFFEAFSTPHVVFLMALQPEHEKFRETIVRAVQENWEGQIRHWELTIAQQSAPADRSPSARARVG